MVLMLKVDSSVEGSHAEDGLVESILATLTKDEPGAACAFLEANNGNEACQSLLNMWNRLVYLPLSIVSSQVVLLLCCKYFVLLVTF